MRGGGEAGRREEGSVGEGKGGGHCKQGVRHGGTDVLARNLS